MTREEELQQAVDNFSEAHKYEGGLDYLSMGIAFEEGAQWADEHPDLSSLWHDASEMPNNHSYIMLMIDRYTIKTDYVPACLKHCQLNGGNWDEFAKDANIRQWAYVDDLLPKTKE